MWEVKKYTTLEIGTKVKLQNGETGEIISNARLTQYEIKIDGQDKTYLFDYRFVEVNKNDI